MHLKVLRGPGSNPHFLTVVVLHDRKVDCRVRGAEEYLEDGREAARGPGPIALALQAANRAKVGTL